VPFAAVELKPSESAHAVVHHVLKVADQLGNKFASLEFLGYLTLGRIQFIRVRSESRLLSKTLETLDRGTILQEGADFFLRFPGEEPKKVSISKMCIPGDTGIKRTYRGPGVRLWERQFI